MDYFLPFYVKVIPEKRWDYLLLPPRKKHLVIGLDYEGSDWSFLIPSYQKKLKWLDSKFFTFCGLMDKAHPEKCYLIQSGDDRNQLHAVLAIHDHTALCSDMNGNFVTIFGIGEKGSDYRLR